jgi:hypothetical protein
MSKNPDSDKKDLIKFQKNACCIGFFLNFANVITMLLMICIAGDL